MTKNRQFLSTKQGMVLLGGASLIAAWFMFIRAVDTGSLQQYAMLIVLAIFGINRLVKAIYPAKQ